MDHLSQTARSMWPPNTLTPAQAASQAAASHVWHASYAQGVSAGWNAGWAAAMAEMQGPVPTKLDDLSTVMEQEERGDECGGFELNESWARLFACGEMRRQRGKGKHEVDSEEGELEIDLGGQAEREREENGRKMYGEGWKEVRGVEVGMEADFERRVAECGGRRWPVVGVKEGGGG